MTPESELLADLRGPFLSLAQAVIRECPASEVRTEAVSLLASAQDAAARASRWSPPPPAPPARVPDDQARARRREAANVPARLR
jgi:hypothetical protein